MYDATRLDAELKAAGLEIEGCSSAGVIWWATPPTPEQEAAAQQVLDAHDPTPRPDQRPLIRERLRVFRGKSPRTQAEQAVHDLLDYLGI